MKQTTFFEAAWPSLGRWKVDTSFKIDPPWQISLPKSVKHIVYYDINKVFLVSIKLNVYNLVQACSEKQYVGNMTDNKKTYTNENRSIFLRNRFAVVVVVVVVVAVAVVAVAAVFCFY